MGEKVCRECCSVAETLTVPELTGCHLVDSASPSQVYVLSVIMIHVGPAVLVKNVVGSSGNIHGFEE